MYVQNSLTMLTRSMSLHLYRLVRNLVQSFLLVLARFINDQYNLVIISCAQSSRNTGFC